VATLIDASVLIAAERGRLDLDAIVSQEADEVIALAAITVSELLHGIHRAARPAQRARREAFVEPLLAAVAVVPFDLVVARVHARLWAQVASAERPVGAHDLLIAATAIATGCRVATRDTRSFPHIPGLSLVRWQLGRGHAGRPGSAPVPCSGSDFDFSRRSTMTALLCWRSSSRRRSPLRRSQPRQPREGRQHNAPFSAMPFSPKPQEGWRISCGSCAVRVRVRPRGGRVTAGCGPVGERGGL
jgi:predicted nucleic acid-binding protein